MISAEILRFKTMDKIINYNCDGLCIEETCSDKYTHSQTIELNTLSLVVGFCEEHSKVWDKERARIYDTLIEKRYSNKEQESI